MNKPTEKQIGAAAEAIWRAVAPPHMENDFPKEACIARALYLGAARAALTAALAVEAGTVGVKPLDLSNLLKHAFFSGAGLGDLEKASDDLMQRWCAYDPEGLAPYDRIVAALTTSPASSGVEGEAVAWRTMDSAPKDEEFIGRCSPQYKGFSCFWNGEAFVHYDADDGMIYYPVTEWTPFPQGVAAPAPQTEGSTDG